MRKLWLKIAVAILVIAIAGTSIYLYRKNNQPPIADFSGAVTVEMVDIAGNVTSQQLTFETGDTLLSLLAKHYEVNYRDDQFGAVLLGIDHIQPDFITSYIAIYVNNEYYNYGISNIVLEQGTIYSFRETAV